jgi:hypothetical protein
MSQLRFQELDKIVNDDDSPIDLTGDDEFLQKKTSTKVSSSYELFDLTDQPDDEEDAEISFENRQDHDEEIKNNRTVTTVVEENLKITEDKSSITINLLSKHSTFLSKFLLKPRNLFDPTIVVPEYEVSKDTFLAAFVHSLPSTTTEFITSTNDDDEENERNTIQKNSNDKLQNQEIEDDLLLGDFLQVKQFYLDLQSSSSLQRQLSSDTTNTATTAPVEKTPSVVVNLYNLPYAATEEEV